MIYLPVCLYTVFCLHNNFTVLCQHMQLFEHNIILFEVILVITEILDELSTSSAGSAEE